jgi:hypothetical protein
MNPDAAWPAKVVEYLRLLGVERVAGAEWQGVWLPLFVTSEQRDWPWEPPVSIVTSGAIIDAIGGARPGIPLKIDGRVYWRLMRRLTAL